MDKLCISNGSKLAPRNCLQLITSPGTQSNTKIQKKIELGHKPACDIATMRTENVTKRGFGIGVHPNISQNHKITV